MKKEPKLIICSLIFVLGAFGNLFFSTALHLLLSRQMTVLKLLPLSECINSLFQSRQHGMLYLCLQGFILILAIMYYFTNLRPYQSDLLAITPDIKTPVSVGQFQHGSARWLKDEEKDKAFDSFILDPSHPLIKQLLMPEEKFKA
ncbi:TRAG family protein [Dehalobacter sp. 14DCB1]|uniref:TRAG family protein n=1 Tax=Dehalobacter sp. 14DCB1 TaxID=2070227 RepID=UPI001049BFE8|nr:TRAG family protein [Dehalobacter sp. 14DCB1]TCX53629.1 TRAG family protein [Dehalobacter sp. 14DCB1]